MAFPDSSVKAKLKFPFKYPNWLHSLNDAVLENVVEPVEIGEISHTLLFTTPFSPVVDEIDEVITTFVAGVGIPRIDTVGPVQ